MPKPGRAAVILLAALALLGCESKKKSIARYMADDRAVSLPEAPFHFAQATADAKVELTLSPDLDAYPDLHRALFDAGQRQLLEFIAQAKEDRARFAAKGVSQPQPYERRVTWTVAAVTPGLVSLRGAWFDDTGGIHPNHGSDTFLWDRDHGQMLLQSDLFKPGYDLSALDQTLCAAVRKAKQARLGPTDPKSWSCPKWEDSHATLVPSVRPYRAGGLMFLFDPYVIGAYAEGDYAVLIPLSDVQPALAPMWAADFAGSPAPSVIPNP